MHEEWKFDFHLVVSHCSFVYGEGTYAEVFGDIQSAYLPPAQLQLAQKLAQVSINNKVPLIGVYVGGRDRLLAHFDPLFDAHLAAFYPGPFGGVAVSRILRGAAVPSARLPITLHAADAQTLPYWRAHADYASIPPSIVQMDRYGAVRHHSEALCCTLRQPSRQLCVCAPSSSNAMDMQCCVRTNVFTLAARRALHAVRAAIHVACMLAGPPRGHHRHVQRHVVQAARQAAVPLWPRFELHHL